jgi:hypothetical protein
MSNPILAGRASSNKENNKIKNQGPHVFRIHITCVKCKKILRNNIIIPVARTIAISDGVAISFDNVLRLTELIKTSYHATHA